MVAEVFSYLGLCFMAMPLLVHGFLAPEFFVPRTVLNIVHFLIFPLFSRRRLRRGEMLTVDDYTDMLSASISKMPPVKRSAACDLVFMTTLEQRQGSAAFVAIGVASVYACTLQLAFRHPIHLCAAILSFGQLLSHVNHLCTPFTNAFVTRHGQMMSMVFGPVNAVGGAMNTLGFIASRDAAGLSDEYRWGDALAALVLGLVLGTCMLGISLIECRSSGDDDEPEQQRQQEQQPTGVLTQKQPISSPSRGHKAAVAPAPAAHAPRCQIAPTAPAVAPAARAGGPLAAADDASPAAVREMMAELEANRVRIAQLQSFVARTTSPPPATTAYASSSPPRPGLRPSPRLPSLRYAPSPQPYYVSQGGYHMPAGAVGRMVQGRARRLG